MKKLLLLTTLLVLGLRGFADNFDFAAVCESGQTLYYRIKNDHEVMVVGPRIPNSTAPWIGYDKPTGDLVIPETVEYEGNTYTVVSIGDSAFRGCQELTSVQLPNLLRRIEAEAFDACTGLTGAFVIPDHCTFIGAFALWDCNNFTSLTIGAAVDTIQWSAFEDCTSLQTIYCNTPALPFAQHIPSNDYYQDRSIFHHVPTDIPVYVSCLAMDQFLMDQDWSRFTNLEGVFVGAPSLTVEVNNPDFGTAEVISIPVDCDVTTATVRATPKPGRVFGYWKRNGAVVSYDSQYTFVLDRDVSLMACFDCSVTVYDSIGYPTHVIGKTINASGQVTQEHASDFIYGTADGQLTKYEFLGNLITSFSFYDYPTMPSSVYTVYAYWQKSAKDPGPYYGLYSYIYENYQKTHAEYFSWTNWFDNGHLYWDYYYDDHHISQEDCTQSDDDYLGRHLYTYDNAYKTRIDQYYVGHTNNLMLSKVTTNNYDEQHKLLTSQTNTYDNAGEITASTLKTYTYTPHNKTDSIITQNYNDGSWLNTGVIHYEYDDKDHVLEYQTGSWSAENARWKINKKIIYEFNNDLQTLTVSFKKKNDDEWTWDYYTGQSLFNDTRLNEWEKVLYDAHKGLQIGQFVFDIHYDMVETEFPVLSEWYYEIHLDNGGVTYQHLEYTNDTTINSERAKVIVRTNQIYDKDAHSVVTHEYIKEENDKVYWWNKDLQEFTLLYDYLAEPGDEWEIKVGNEQITVHVDSVGNYIDYGESRRVLYVSDVNHIFDGDIIVGFGHLTSFFPEKLMQKNRGYVVDGLRCYWVGDALLYRHGDKDCDAVVLYAVDELEAPDFRIHPNPTDGLITIEFCDIPSGQVAEYRITNVLGQTLLMGTSLQPNLTIDVSSLPSGLYFLTLGERSLKFVVR